MLVRLPLSVWAKWLSEHQLNAQNGNTLNTCDQKIWSLNKSDRFFFHQNPLGITQKYEAFPLLLWLFVWLNSKPSVDKPAPWTPRWVSVSPLGPLRKSWVSACLLGFCSHRRWTFTPTSERTFYFRSVAVDHFYLQLLAIHTRIPPCSLCAGRIDRAASAPGSPRSHTAHRFAVSKRQNCSSLKIKLTDRYD